MGSTLSCEPPPPTHFTAFVWPPKRKNNITSYHDFPIDIFTFISFLHVKKRCFKWCLRLWYPIFQTGLVVQLPRLVQAWSRKMDGDWYDTTYSNTQEQLWRAIVGPMLGSHIVPQADKLRIKCNWNHRNKWAKIIALQHQAYLETRSKISCNCRGWTKNTKKLT